MIIAILIIITIFMIRDDHYHHYDDGGGGGDADADADDDHCQSVTAVQALKIVRGLSLARAPRPLHDSGFAGLRPLACWKIDFMLKLST